MSWLISRVSSTAKAANSIKAVSVSGKYWVCFRKGKKMAPYISTWGSVASVAIEVTEFYASLRCAGWPLAGPPFVAADADRAAAQGVADAIAHEEKVGGAVRHKSNPAR